MSRTDIPSNVNRVGREGGRPVSISTVDALLSAPKASDPWAWLPRVQLLAAALLVLGLAWFELSSVDIGYHVAYGNQYFSTGHIVAVDPFIYGATGHRFINANWLSQVVMAALFNRFDWIGLIALRIGLIAVMFACIAGPMRAAGASAAWIAWGLVAAAIGSYERFSMRPELFSYAIMLGQLWLLLRGPRRVTLVAVPLLEVAWVNLHSYFLIGPMMTAAMATGELLQRWFAPRAPRVAAAAADAAVSTASPTEFGIGPPPVAPFRRWLLLLTLQLAACLVNPWHINGAIFPIKAINYLRGSNAMAHDPADPAAGPWGIVSEFQSPFGFIGFPGASRTTYAYLVLLVFALLGALAALWRRRFGPLFVMLILTAISTQMRRNIAPFALVAAPLALLGLRDFVVRTTHPRTASATAGRKPHRPRLSAVGGRVASCMGIALCSYWWAGLWTGDFYFSERRPGRRLAVGWSDYIFPFAGIDWLNHQPSLRPRLFTDLMLSSNVLPWLRKDMQVFITTNTFAYPPGQLMRAWNVCIGKEDYRPLMSEYGVNVVMLRANDATNGLIGGLNRDPDWSLVWLDSFVVIYARRIPEHQALIAANERVRAHLDVAAWLSAARQPHVATAYRLSQFASVPLALRWYDRARPLIEAALTEAPDYSELWNNLGICHNERAKEAGKAGDLAAANAALREGRRCFENALRLDAKNREARFNLDRTPLAIER